ncbi:TCP-1/cpn60 chaperonin family protein [Gloeobacter kilaueensis]|uniref:Thermosome n=1 Tax=Gloeobacter kilaueensis (strain ATCC BAA-2537 / CCAP 1431/1 / ULC 316 / JS1) TaxID=1183438 RepID=U5QP01_GLOK1|nr:TCP-1/cpn60 chaperonin family protein [Gloeobacter kilaueensis]AGY60732.1 thermosome [Gloeobacter kilaueensis JS1]
MNTESYLKVLRTNVAAVRAVVEVVAATLGPKGLDVLLVDEAGRLTLTNDGIEILGQLDAQHPAARLVIQVAEAQDRSVGDGTTTATVLAGALLDAALERVEQGIAINPLIAGLRLGLQAALDALQESALPLTGFEDERLFAVARIAARGDEAIARVVFEAARHIGVEPLGSGKVPLGKLVLSEVGAAGHRWLAGVAISKQPLTPPPENSFQSGAVLVLADHFEAEPLDSQLLGTEGGFSRFLETQEQLRRQVQALSEAGVVLLVCEKSIAPAAEPLLAEARITALQRVLRRDSERVSLFCGGGPVYQRQITAGPATLTPLLGKATVRYERNSRRVHLSDGGGLPLATIVVGAVSAEIAAESERIAIDASGALQAALRSGVVTGGGAAEWASRRAVQALAGCTEGMTRYGIEALAVALARPLEQIAINSGFSALEKVAQLEAAQTRTGNLHLGIDCESGAIVDLRAAGVVDPLAVKTCALEAAVEIALRILRIQTVVRRRETPPADA